MSTINIAIFECYIPADASSAIPCRRILNVRNYASHICNCQLIIYTSTYNTQIKLNANAILKI